MANCSGVAPYHSEVAMARNTSAPKQDLANPQQNHPSRRTAVEPDPGEGFHTHTESIHHEVGRRMLDNAMGIVELERNTPAVMAKGK